MLVTAFVSEWSRDGYQNVIAFTSRLYSMEVLFSVVYSTSIFCHFYNCKVGILSSMRYNVIYFSNSGDVHILWIMETIEGDFSVGDLSD